MGNKIEALEVLDFHIFPILYFDNAVKSPGLENFSMFTSN